MMLIAAKVMTNKSLHKPFKRTEHRGKNPGYDELFAETPAVLRKAGLPADHS